MIFQKQIDFYQVPYFAVNVHHNCCVSWNFGVEFSLLRDPQGMLGRIQIHAGAQTQSQEMISGRVSFASVSGFMGIAFGNPAVFYDLGCGNSVLRHIDGKIILQAGRCLKLF